MEPASKNFKTVFINAYNLIRNRLSKRSFLGIFIIGLLFLGILLTVWVSQKQTNTSSKATNKSVSSNEIDILTEQLLQSFEEYEQAVTSNESKDIQISTASAVISAPPSSASAVKGENTSKEIEEKEAKMIMIAEKRKDLLLKTMQTNPQEFLDKATLVDKREQLPEQVKPLIEKRVDTEGLLTLVHIDYFKEKKSEDDYNYLLKQPDVKNQPGNVDYELHFAKNPPKALSGSRVKITKGIGIEQEVVIANGGGGTDSSIQIIAPAVFTPPLGEQKTAVLLINFSDKPDDKPVALEEIRTKMFSKTASSVDAYYKENSFNKISFSGDVFGWYTIPFNKCSGVGSDYYYWGIAGLKQAVSSGVVFDDYRRFIYVFPDSHNCISAGGLGEIGNNYPYPTQSWIFGESYIDVKVFEHELGHNLGLHHANSISCSYPGDYTHCSQYEYGDVYDIMGNFMEFNNSFHFNGPHKFALGWIPETNIINSASEGTYTIVPLEALSSRPQILQIPKPDSNEYYFVSYRQKQGFDSNLPDKMTVGASIHIWQPNVNIAYRTKFLKAIYGDPIDVLSDGKIFNDKINNISIKQLSHNASEVTVKISRSSPSTTPTLPPSTPTPFPQTDGFGKALKFDGIDDRFISYRKSIPATDQMTVEAWVNPASAQDSPNEECPIIMAKLADLGWPTWTFTWGPDIPRFNFQTQSGGSLRFLTNTTIAPNTWSHIAYSLDKSAGIQRFFVNGKKVAESNIDPEFQFKENNKGIGIGAGTYSPDLPYKSHCFYKGLIDEVRISSSTRYANNFTLPFNPFRSDDETVALWHFDDNLFDYSSKNNNGSQVGEIQFVESLAIATPTPTPTFTPTPTPKSTIANISKIEPNKGISGSNVTIFGSAFDQKANQLYFYNSQGYTTIDKSGFSQLKGEQTLKFAVPDTICANSGSRAGLPTARGGGGCSSIDSIKTPLGSYKLTFYNFDLGNYSNDVDFEVIQAPTPTPTPTPTPIPSITVLSPNGGEKWQVGNTYPIKWQASNIDKVIINASDYTCSPEIVRTIATNISANQNFYDWKMPNDFLIKNSNFRCPNGQYGWKSGDNFKIFVAQVYDNGRYGVLDESDNYFNVVSAPIPTPTPLPLSLKIDLRLLGIGISAGNNKDPLNKNKTATINLFTDSLYKKSLSAATATVTYNSSSSSFKGAVNLGNIKNGMHYMTIKINKYITKKTPFYMGGGQSQNRRTPLSIGQFSLTPADLNNDNVINDADGNILNACLDKTTSACISSSDANDDGKVNSTDYNLYTKYLGYTK